MNKKTIAIGFTLFAMFFGAGNLIFPPSLGLVSGNMFSWAILGFVITGVGLPFLGVIAGSFSERGFINEAKRVHPVFAILFMLAIYLTIGPFFAIPRTATVSYEMGIVPFLGDANTIWSITVGSIEIKVPLLLFTSVYFVLTYALSISPSKLVERVGQVLTPLLLIFIVALVVRAIFIYGGEIPEPIADVQPAAPFFHGFLEGYNTMDTLAAIAFCIVVLNAIKATGISEQQMIFKDALKAALIAGVCLALVYISLGWVGNHYVLSADDYEKVTNSGQNLGTYILTSVAHVAYGWVGKFLLSAIVGLACLTTSIGLVVAVSSYFHELWPRHSYKTYASVFTLISFVLANQGLNQVIKGSIPVLLIVYPIAIALIVLVFVDRLLKGVSNLAYQLPIYTVSFISIMSVIVSMMASMATTKTIYAADGAVLETVDVAWKAALQGPAQSLHNWLQGFLPFSDISMQWLLPSIVAFVIACIISAMKSKDSV